MSHSSEAEAVKRAPLGLWDVVSITIGIVVGAGIYETPPIIFRNVAGPWAAMGVWLLGGAMSLVGALCLAELAASYPRSGGDYVYLTRAFGSWLGFLFAWFQLSVVRAANIAMMGFVFADYASSIKKISIEWLWLWASAPILVLMLLNLLGVVFGRRTQNVLTIAKVVGLGGVLLVGIVVGFGADSSSPSPSAAFQPSLATAMVLVLLTYGGWNDAAFVAAEVRGGSRAMVRALLLGTAAVTLIYLLLNAAFLWGLGFETARQSKAIATDLLERGLGAWGGRAIALLVMLSALGAINGMMFSGARVYAALGGDHSVFAWLGRVQSRTRTPWGALLIQSAISIGLILAIGTPNGRAAIDRSLRGLGLAEVQWTGHGGFEVLSVVTTPLFWLFFLFCGLSVFVLRQLDTSLERPFRVPLYPELPLLFCGICAYMVYAGVEYAKTFHFLAGLVVVSFALLLAGLLLFRFSRWMDSRMKSQNYLEDKLP
jgi:APA family basic amino acid/polyamine antiporter